MIHRLYTLYATGNYSKEISKIAHADGLLYRESGNQAPTSTIHKILRNHLGDFDFDGGTYRGAF